MNQKSCSRCGKSMDEEAFLCPHCGAIWGDRFYSKADAEEASCDCATSHHNEGAPAEGKRKYKGLLFGASIVLTVAFLAVVGFALKQVTGQTAPSSDSEPASTTTFPLETTAPTTVPPFGLPTEPSPYVEYTIRFITRDGQPVEHVRVSCSFALLSGIAIYESNSEGMIVMQLPVNLGLSLMPEFQIISIPEGYDDTKIGQTFGFGKLNKSYTIIIEYQYDTDVDVPDIH